MKKLIKWIMRILYHPRKLARIHYGLLYNWYAATDARNIAPDGWHLPTETEAVALREAIEPGSSWTVNGVSEHLKEDGLVYWDADFADNSTGYSARGAGIRGDGVDPTTYDFRLLNNRMVFLLNTTGTGVTRRCSMASSSTLFSRPLFTKVCGSSVRLLKDDDTDPGSMQDNNGYVYPTVKIGSQVWMAANMKTTKYRNGDTIPEVTDGPTWSALTSGALCAYDNDWNYV